MDDFEKAKVVTTGILTQTVELSGYDMGAQKAADVLRALALNPELAAVIFDVVAAHIREHSAKDATAIVRGLLSLAASLGHDCNSEPCRNAREFLERAA